MDPSILPLNEKIDASVRNYAERIAHYVKEFNPDVIVDLDFDDSTNTELTERATTASIQTEFGLVSVFPNFRSGGSSAAILNRGLVNAMVAEGFTEEEINDAVIYSSLLEYNESNAELLGAVLAKDMGFQHQKGAMFETGEAEDER